MVFIQQQGDEVRATQHMPFLFGSYSMGKWAIPYFSTSITFREAAESLGLTNDLAAATDVSWKVEELFQRDIDWARVSGGIVKYLQNSDLPQFFNSLTVALLPNGDHRGFDKRFSDYSDSEWHSPGIDKSQFPVGFQKDIGPISMGYAQEWDEPGDLGSQIGVLRWNKDEVLAVAIDGQHRLAAIKEAVDARLIDSTIASKNRIPVIFLLFEPVIGFKGDADSTPLDVMRMLFIDLNKHAVTVSRARQILLDDLDPISLCVRSVISDGLTSTVDELYKESPRIPLSLVDWHSEQAKFDKGPYLTTVLGLDWIVSKVLNVSVAKDTTDYSSFRSQIRQLENSLGIDLEETRLRLKEYENDGAPFTYTHSTPDSELTRISKGFERVWTPGIVKQFAEFTPYKELINTRISIDTIDAEYCNWYYMLSRASGGHEKSKSQYDKLMNALKNRDVDPKSESKMLSSLDDIESVKDSSGAGLAFNVVFQRAYFLAMIDFTKLDEDDLLEGLPGDFDPSVFEDLSDSEDEDPPNDDQESHDDDPVAVMAEEIASACSRFVDGMNHSYACINGLLDVNLIVPGGERTHRFWDGTLRKPEGGIDFTQGASVRAKEVILWLVAVSRYLEASPDNSFEDFWSEMKDDGIFAQQMRGSFRRFYSNATSAAGRILAAADIDFDDQVSERECELRVEFIWNSLKDNA